MVKYLQDHGAAFRYGVTVNNVEFELTAGKKAARAIVGVDENGADFRIQLTDNDMVYITNGSMTESSNYDSDTTPAVGHAAYLRNTSLRLARERVCSGVPPK